MTSPAGQRLRTPILLALLAAGSMLLSACDGSSSAAAGPTQITVVDYNILHGLFDEDRALGDYDGFEQRLTLLASALAYLKPDVIVLQEVVLSGPPDYPNVRDLLLAALGGEYQAVFAEQGTERINQGTLGRMTLTRLPLVSSVNRPIFPGRSAHRVTVQTKGGVIDIYNVHLEGPELVGAQEFEVTRLLNFIDGNLRNQNPVIIAGDFNSRPGDAAIVKVHERNFVDVLATKKDVSCSRVGDPGCTRAQFPSLTTPMNLASIRIDYMFSRRGSDLDLRIVSAVPFLNHPIPTEGDDLLWLSDHIGVLATFEVSKTK